MLDKAVDRVQSLKTDLAAWKKLADVYAPSISSARSVKTPTGGRKKRSEPATPGTDPKGKKPKS